MIEFQTTLTLQVIGDRPLRPGMQLWDTNIFSQMGMIRVKRVSGMRAFAEYRGIGMGAEAPPGIGSLLSTTGPSARLNAMRAQRDRDTSATRDATRGSVP